MPQLLVLPASGQEIIVAASEIARTLNLELRQQGQTSVAISTFRDLKGKPSDLGDFFSEELGNELIKLRGEDLKIVERSRTDAIFAEQKLGLDGLRAPRQLDALAAVLPVDAIVVGTISEIPELGEKIRIHARLIAVPSGEALASASAFLCMDDHASPRLPKTDEKPAKPETPTQMSQTVNDFLFELMGCESSGSQLICKFMVTNQEGNRNLQITGRSRLFTSEGKEISSDEQEIGKSRSGNTASTDTVRGIRVQGALRFEGIPALSGKLPLLELNCHSGDRFTVQFFDVPL